MYARAGGQNVNLWWGAVMIGTGALFLGLARRAARAGRGAAMRTAADTPAGRETERREQALGLEREDGGPRPTDARGS
jgi:hypothetical protein